MDSRTRLTEFGCTVCGELQDSGGKYYRAHVCNGCRNFFKREVRSLRASRVPVTVRSVQEHVTCPKRAACKKLDPVNRTQCPQHRLLACLKAGMNPDAVQERKVRNSASEKLIKTTPSWQLPNFPPNVLPPPAGLPLSSALGKGGMGEEPNLWPMSSTFPWMEATAVVAPTPRASDASRRPCQLPPLHGGPVPRYPGAPLYHHPQQPFPGLPCGSSSPPRPLCIGPFGGTSLPGPSFHDSPGGALLSPGLCFPGNRDLFRLPPRPCLHLPSPHTASIGSLDAPPTANAFLSSPSECRLQLDKPSPFSGTRATGASWGVSAHPDTFALARGTAGQRAQIASPNTRGPHRRRSLPPTATCTRAEEAMSEGVQSPLLNEEEGNVQTVGAPVAVSTGAHVGLPAETESQDTRGSHLPECVPTASQPRAEEPAASDTVQAPGNEEGNAQVAGAPVEYFEDVVDEQNPSDQRNPNPAGSPVQNIWRPYI